MVAKVSAMGNRKKPAEKRTEQLKIMVTESWLKELQEAADSWGMTVSEYVRVAVEEKKRRDSTTKTD